VKLMNKTSEQNIREEGIKKKSCASCWRGEQLIWFPKMGMRGELPVLLETT
jgi:hypothetical protein